VNGTSRESTRANWLDGLVILVRPCRWNCPEMDSARRATVLDMADKPAATKDAEFQEGTHSDDHRRETAQGAPPPYI
jgi:hypothetical protein